MTEQHCAYVFDAETTGKHQPVIIETALLPMLIVEGYPLPAAMQAEVHRWNPGKPIEAGAWATHFIEDADVANERPSAEFALPTHNHYLIGHNVDYDWDVAGKPKNVCRICRTPDAPVGRPTDLQCVGDGRAAQLCEGSSG